MQLNLEEIRAIAELVQKKGLNQIVVESTDANAPPCRLELGREIVVAPTAPLATVAPNISSSEDESATPAAAEDDMLIVTSPAVGIFHFTDDGITEEQEIAESQVVGIVESLKVPSEIRAASAGIVQEILTRNGQGVEFGQPLLKLRTA